MNKRIGRMSAALLWLGSAGYVMNASAVDLLSVVEQTTDRDADLAASRAGAKAARQAVPIARAALLPQLGGGWGRAYNSIGVQEFPRTSYWQNGWTVSLTQTVFDWSRWKTLKQASVIEARGAVEVAQAQQASILRAVQGYFEALGAEDELERSTNYAATLAGHLEEVRRKRVAGEATVIDLRDAETGLQQAQLQQLGAREDLQLKRLALEQMTGQPFAGLSGLSKSVPMPRLEPEDADSWAAQAEAHDYGVQLKQLDWRIAKLEVEKARAGHLPTVSVSASHTPAGAASGYSRPTTTTTAMLSISIPLFEGGGTVARVGETVALADRAQNELLSATRQAGASARENGLRFRAGVSRTGSLTRLVESSRVALEATQIGYRVGSRTGTDVLRAADVFYQAGRDLIKARYETLVALMQLQGTTATLDFEVVARVNAMLVPAVGAVPPQ